MVTSAAMPAPLDPRRILDDAAQERVVCELLPRRGGVIRARLVRIERTGLVVTVPQRSVTAGADLRVWFRLRGTAYAFEASAVRVGVPVPDRSADGVLLGFLDGFREDAHAAGSGASGRRFALLPPSGRAISLLEPPARVVHLGVESATFTLPADFRLVFVHSGRVTVELAVPGGAPVAARASVRALSKGDGYLLYDLFFEEVDDAQAWRATVEPLARSLA